MDHDEAVRQKATERYLLDELDPEERDRFEEHLFDCQDCALDMRATAMFIEQSKAALSQPPDTPVVRVPVPVPERMGWLAWMRPSFTMPALAALLLVVGYQNFVQLPRLELAANQPHVLPATSINLLTFGSNPSPLVVRAGEGFLVNVIIPPGTRYSSFQLDLYNPKGKVELSLPVLAASSDDTWPVQIPGANREGGTYSLAVHATTAEGKQVEVGRGSFELQIQK